MTETGKITGKTMKEIKLMSMGNLQSVTLNLFYVKIHVKLPQVFTILREYSRKVHSAKFHI